jgi:hypothetical protein
MTTGKTNEQRLEAAVRRLPLLPERKTEISRAVTGLLFVIRSAAASPEHTAAAKAEEDERTKERHDASYAAAVEIRDVEWALYDLKEAWDRLSAQARDALVARLRGAGRPENNLLTLVDLHAQVVESVALAADDLEHPDRPVIAKPLDDAALVIAKHAARVFTRLTGKTPPKPRQGEKITPGAFFWFLEDIFRTARITASVESYIRKLAES